MSMEFGEKLKFLKNKEVFRSGMDKFLGATGFFGLLGLAGMVARNERVARSLTQLWGERVETVLKGHGADMAFIGVLSLVGAALLNSLDENHWQRVFKKAKKEDVVVIFNSLVGLFYAAEELSRIKPHGFDTFGREMIRNFTTGGVRGDWGDVLVYSVPLIAGGIFYAGKLASRLNLYFNPRRHGGGEGGGDDILGFDGVDNGFEVVD